MSLLRCVQQFGIRKRHLYKLMQCSCFVSSASDRLSANYKMPLDTVLCLDTSASMGFNNNEGINQLKAAALKFLEGVEETARQADLKVRPRKCEAFRML